MGKTITARIRAVSELTFEDEAGQRHRFTFRTIETWRLRCKKHGFTAICPTQRCDKGKTRKISPEELLEAIEQVQTLLPRRSLQPRRTLPPLH